METVWRYVVAQSPTSLDKPPTGFYAVLQMHRRYPSRKQILQTFLRHKNDIAVLISTYFLRRKTAGMVSSTKSSKLGELSTGPNLQPAHRNIWLTLQHFCTYLFFLESLVWEQKNFCSFNKIIQFSPFTFGLLRLFCWSNDSPRTLQAADLEAWPGTQASHTPGAPANWQCHKDGTASEHEVQWLICCAAGGFSMGMTCAANARIAPLLPEIGRKYYCPSPPFSLWKRKRGKKWV